MMMATHTAPDPSDGWILSLSRAHTHWLAGAYTMASMNPATTLNLDAWMKGRALGNYAKGL